MFTTQRTSLERLLFLHAHGLCKVQWCEFALGSRSTGGSIIYDVATNGYKVLFPAVYHTLDVGAVDLIVS